MTEESDDESVNKTFDEALKEAAKFDDLNESANAMATLLGFSDAVMSTPVPNPALRRIKEQQKGLRWGQVMKELRQAELAEVKAAEAKGSGENGIKGVMELLGETLKRQEKLDTARAKDDKLKGWSYPEFKQPQKFQIRGRRVQILPRRSRGLHATSETV